VQVCCIVCDVVTEYSSESVVRLTRLRYWRERRALTQEELAEKADITRVALARIEACKAEPRPSTTRAIAKALEVKIDDLMDPVQP
jgi:transcriptional regulator with XRE-family HTH domain